MNESRRYGEKGILNLLYQSTDTGDVGTGWSNSDRKFLTDFFLLNILLTLSQLFGRFGFIVFVKTVLIFGFNLESMNFPLWKVDDLSLPAIQLSSTLISLGFMILNCWSNSILSDSTMLIP